MAIRYMPERELLSRLQIDSHRLSWFEEAFREQMRQLCRQGSAGREWAEETLALLGGLSNMLEAGATPEQIKSWFGLP
jgi:hypothetical protein